MKDREPFTSPQPLVPRAPGHGVTGGRSLALPERPAFLEQLLKALAVKQPLVLVTPSMSGSYAL